jgi:MFS family permease
MDVPTRASYVIAVVTPPERPAAASITAVPKTFAWAAGSLISGYLLTLSTFGWPLLIAAAIKGVYDILLLIKFQKSASTRGSQGGGELIIESGVNVDQGRIKAGRGRREQRPRATSTLD